MSPSPRHSASLERTTRETTIRGSLDLATGGTVNIATGIGFLDHMLTALATHGGFSLTLQCTGDLHIDDHHTAEDCAIVLGRLLDAALADRIGLTRFGYAYAPLDESLARSVLDLVARPTACINLSLQREVIGTIATENLTHFLRTLAMEGRFTLHIDVLRGDNDHHKVEAAFKSLALALRQAIASSPAAATSTKGTLT
jgi:imidazoleglycerol phosphate dehydratase HisB